MIAVIAQTDLDRWGRIPAPGVWAIGKDAEHVIQATAYHEWILRLTIGETVSSRRPILARSRLTTDLSPEQAVELLRRRGQDLANLVRGLDDEQLQLPTRPPRARSQALSVTIERVLIGHIGVHRGQIEAKLRAVGS